MDDRWAEDRTKISPHLGGRYGNSCRQTYRIIKAFVQLRSTYSPSEKLSREILEYLGRYLATNKVPRELEFVRELPKTTTGKIRRSELKNREIEKRKGK
jgi:acyl-coenzyme A synthetase/AMP-(fatty) acid ligase